MNRFKKYKNIEVVGGSAVVPENVIKQINK